MNGNGNNANLLKTCPENIREIAASELFFGVLQLLHILLRKVQQETKWYSFLIFDYDFYTDGGNFLTFGLESKSTILYLVINV